MTYPKTGGVELAFPQDNADAVLNGSIRRLDALASSAIIVDRDLTAPPGSCADGANYLVAASGTGAWASRDGNLATAVGTNAANGWTFQTVAVEGFILAVQDENIDIRYNGSSWITVSTGGNPTETILIAVGDETTAITTGTAKVTFRMPYAFTVTAVRASLTTVSSSGIPTVDINEAGVSILSTKLTIDASEKTSTTAATAAVISDASLADDAEMTIDIDVAGTGAAGLKVYIIGYRT